MTKCLLVSGAVRLVGSWFPSRPFPSRVLGEFKGASCFDAVGCALLFVKVFPPSPEVRTVMRYRSTRPFEALVVKAGGRGVHCKEGWQEVVGFD